MSTAWFPRPTNAVTTARQAARAYQASFQHKRGSLPDQLLSAIPSCAQSCISTYISQEFGTCDSNDYLCLCSQYSSAGYTLGELSYGCLTISCDKQTVQNDEQTAWQICTADAEAVPALHTEVLYLPSTTATTLSSSTIATTSSVSSQADSTTSAVSSVPTSIDNSGQQSSTSTTRASTSSSGVDGAFSSSTSSAIVAASAHSPSSGLTTAQAVGISVAVFGTILAIIAIAFCSAIIRRRRTQNKTQRDRERQSYDFIDEAPAQNMSSPAYRPAEMKSVQIAANGLNTAPQDTKMEREYAREYSTIHQVPPSIRNDRQKFDADPFTDHNLAVPPKVALYPTNTPSSEHNSMLLPEKPRSLGPPPPPKNAHLMPSRPGTSVAHAGVAEEDKTQASMANFSRPALPAQQKQVYLPSNPKVTMAPPPALVRRELPEQHMMPKSTTHELFGDKESSLRPSPQPTQYTAYGTASPESTRKVSLSLDIPRQANKSVSASPPVQVFPAVAARGTTPLRIVNRTPSPKVLPVHNGTDQLVQRPLRPQRSGPSPLALSVPIFASPQLSMPDAGEISSSSLARSQASATTDQVLDYYTSPDPSHDSPGTARTSTTPVDEDAQRRKAVPMAIAVTKPAYVPRAVRANPRHSGGSDTSFESNDSDEPSLPGENLSGVKALSPVHETQMQQPQQSPIATIQYPKVPQSSNQASPASPARDGYVRENDRLSPTYASPRSAGLAGLIEQSQLSPRQQGTRRMIPEQQKVDTSTLSGSTLVVKRRGDGEAQKFIIDTSHARSRVDARQESRNDSGTEGGDKGTDINSARSLAQRGSPLKGYSRVSTGGNASGGRRTPHSAAYGGPPLSGGQLRSGSRTNFSPGTYKARKVPPALMIGNGFQAVGSNENIMKQEARIRDTRSQLWEPKLTPRRRGDDLFLDVSLASPM